LVKALSDIGSGFQKEKAPLHLQSPAVTAELTLTGQYPVAWDNDGQWIPAQSLSYRPHCPRLANLLSYPGVASGLAVGNKPGYLPYLAPKGSGWGQVKLIRESYLMTAKVYP
jgi:hypothetical protein